MMCRLIEQCADGQAPFSMVTSTTNQSQKASKTNEMAEKGVSLENSKMRDARTILNFSVLLKIFPVLPDDVNIPTVGIST